jgi:hypothetical protein
VSHALTQMRWVMSRFATVDKPGWTAPDEEELRHHFGDHYLRLVPPEALTGLLGSVAQRLRADLADVRSEPLLLRARAADLRVEAATEADPPYRLSTLRLYPLETRVTDPRVVPPAMRTSGAVPEEAAAVAVDSFAELGLVGLVVAGASGDNSVWVTARGWASLDREEVLLPEHRFPAYSITKLVTGVAVLRLVGDGRVRLDEPANALGGGIRWPNARVHRDLPVLRPAQNRIRRLGGVPASPRARDDGVAKGDPLGLAPQQAAEPVHLPARPIGHRPGTETEPLLLHDLAAHPLSRDGEDGRVLGAQDPQRQALGPHHHVIHSSPCPGRAGRCPSTDTAAAIIAPWTPTRPPNEFPHRSSAANARCCVASSTSTARPSP